MSDLPLFSYRMTSQILDKGLAQGHNPDGWKAETPWFHYTKAIRHLTTHIMETTHVIEPTDENHAQLAMCRVIMGLYVEKENGKA